MDNQTKETVKVLDIFTMEEPNSSFLVGFCGNPLCGKPIDESFKICPFCNSPLDWSL